MNTKLRNALTDEQAKRLAEVCRDFSNYGLGTVWKYLWNMTYKPKEALEKNGLFDEVYLKYARKVRNEIFEESGKKEIIDVEVNDSNKELFVALTQDKFALQRIIDAMKDVTLHYPWSELERISYLLKSTKEENVFGGLKTLKLNNDEANFFLPYASAISEYFDKKFEETKAVYTGNYIHTKDTDETVDESNEPENTGINKSPSAGESILPSNNEEDTTKEKTLEVFSKLFENKESVLKVIEASIRLDRAIKDEGILIEHTDNTHIILSIAFPKMAEFFNLWDEVQKHIYCLGDGGHCDKLAMPFKKAGAVLKDIEELKEKNIDLDWVIENQDTVKKFLNGEIFKKTE